MKRKFEMEPMKFIETNAGPVKMACLEVFLVPIEKVRPNDYNPNHVSDNNMELLKTSVLANGMCYAIPTAYDDDLEQYVIIDGFHRHLLFWKMLGAKIVPIIDLQLTPAQRVEATVQFNRARGVHETELMGDLVRKLVDMGVPDEEIAKKLGMEMEEAYRLKQITGIADLFKNQEYSKAWEMKEVPEDV